LATYSALVELARICTSQTRFTVDREVARELWRMAAQAGGKDDDGAPVRGIKIGPLGQRFGGPPASGAFAFAPLTRAQVRAYMRLRREQAPLDEE